jgi:hypothetical protein
MMVGVGLEHAGLVIRKEKQREWAMGPFGAKRTSVICRESLSDLMVMDSLNHKSGDYSNPVVDAVVFLKACLGFRC